MIVRPQGMKAFFATHECGETCVAMKLLDAKLHCGVGFRVSGLGYRV